MDTRTGANAVQRQIFVLYLSAPVVQPHERRGEGSEQLIRLQRPPITWAESGYPAVHAPTRMPSRAIPALIEAYRKGNQSVYGAERPKERQATTYTLHPDTAQ